LQQNMTRSGTVGGTVEARVCRGRAGRGQ